MRRIAVLGLITAVLGALTILFDYFMLSGVIPIPLPPYELKLLSVFILTAGLTMAISGIALILVSTFIAIEKICEFLEVSIDELPSEIIKLVLTFGILLVIVIGSAIALILGRLTPDYFMQIVSIIIGVIGGAGITYAIHRCTKKS
ncbi:MAG: hypothetical protein QW332_06035 [Thermoproteota archaeon]